MPENSRHYIRFHASNVLKDALRSTESRPAPMPKPTKFQVKRGKQILAYYQNKPGELARDLNVPTTKAKADKIVNSFLQTLYKTLTRPNFKTSSSAFAKIKQDR